MFLRKVLSLFIMDLALNFFQKDMDLEKSVLSVALQFSEVKDY